MEGFVLFLMLVIIAALFLIAQYFVIKMAVKSAIKSSIKTLSKKTEKKPITVKVKETEKVVLELSKTENEV